jgi:hypothetical protein
MRLQYSPGPLFYLLPLVLFTGLSASPQSEQVVGQTDIGVRERSLVTQSFANERAWLWQRRLSLQDWNISVELARATKLKPRTLGNIHWDADKKKAVIRVLDPADYGMPMKEMLEDIEFTVVHELIHLELASLPRSDASRSEEEHAVNQIARALLALDRKK